MKKIASYISLWHTLFLSSALLIIYLVTVQLTEALTYSSARVVYFNQPHAEITWEASRGPVSHYMLRITDTYMLSGRTSSSTIKRVRDVQCRTSSYNLSCKDNHSYQVDVKAVSFTGVPSGSSPPSILFISDQQKPDIFPDALPSPDNLRSAHITVSGRYREPNLNFISINGSPAAHDPEQETFSGDVTLQPGTNRISIVALDRAGNSSRKELEVLYVPQQSTCTASNESVQPFAVDWDGDATRDLLLGTDEGTVVLYRNRGTSERPLFSDYTFLRSENSGEIIDVGERAVPWMADLSGDGLNDLLVGSGEGYVYYSENQGSRTHPLFGPVELLRDIKDQPISVMGNCQPRTVDWDGNGVTDILLGSINGLVLISINRGDAGDMQFTAPQPLEIDGAPVKVEGTSKPFVADWDADGGKDLLIGDAAGYLHTYLNSVVNGEPDLFRGDVISREEYTPVLEKDPALPYFAGMRMIESIF